MTATETSVPAGGDLWDPLTDPEPNGAMSVPDITDMDTCAAALAYAAAGIYVVPIRRGTKNPGSRVGDKWQRHSTTDPQTIIGHWAGTDDGIALHAGRSGLVMFDIDHPEKLPKPLADAIAATNPPRQSSRANRYHAIFLVPEGRTFGNGRGDLGDGWGEIRGRNGVIVVAPSIHKDAADGAAYEWVHTGPIPVLPDSVADLLPDATDATDAATDATVTAFLAEHTGTERPELVDIWCHIFAKKVTGGASRHDTAVSTLTGAMKEAAAGLIAANDADQRLRDLFLKAVDDPAKSGRRDPWKASSEWSGIRAWAVAQAAAADPAETHRRVAEKAPPEPDLSGFPRSGSPPPGVDPGTGERGEGAHSAATAPNLPEDFWSAWPILEEIRHAARLRSACPDAVLGAVLARVAFATPHMYHLPPLIGSRGSLNVIVGIVAPSGIGKTTAKEIAMELLPVGESSAMLDDYPIGSGEGIVDAFFEQVEEPAEEGSKKATRTVKRQTRTSLFTYVDEGQVLADLGNRKGSVLLPTLRSAWSGGVIGQGNAGQETKRILPGHSYRWAAVVALQPSKAVDILNDDEGGTPQRYLWFSARDANMQRDRVKGTLRPLAWTPPVTVSIPTEMPVADEIADRIHADHVDIHLDVKSVDPLDSHGNLVQLKTAGLLAILDERWNVTNDDWHLAGIIMDTSRAVRDSIIAGARAQRALTEARATERAIRRDAAVATDEERRAFNSATKTIGRHVHRKAKQDDHRCTRVCLNQSVAGKYRHLIDIDEAIETAIAEKVITFDGANYTPGRNKPA